VGEYYCQVFARTYGLETVSLRYFNIFGPRQDPGSPYSGVISRFILALETGELPVIYGDGEQMRDFTYVANVVDANLRAAEAPGASGKVINIAGGKSISINHLLDVLKRLTGRTEVSVQYSEPRLGDVRDSLANLETAQDVLGYAPAIDLETGLQLTLDWWKTSRFSRSA
jgi:UDP-glucose 4-epimerase